MFELLNVSVDCLIKGCVSTKIPITSVSKTQKGCVNTKIFEKQKHVFDLEMAPEETLKKVMKEAG